MLSSEERAEFDAAMKASWSGTRNVAIAVGEMRRLMADAEQAHREWAGHILDEALDRGLAEMAKRWRVAHAPGIPTRKGVVAGVVGTKIRTESGEHWGQLELELPTRSQLDTVRSVRLRNRQAAERDLVALDRLDKLFVRNPTALTVGDALAAEGTTLDALLAGSRAA